MKVELEGMIGGLFWFLESE